MEQPIAVHRTTEQWARSPGTGEPRSSGRPYGPVVGEAIGQVLSLGIGVALSPIPIIAVVLMLATPRGRLNGLVFVAGWVVGLSVLGTVVLLAASGGDASNAGAPADWVSVLKLALGAL